MGAATEIRQPMGQNLFTKYQFIMQIEKKTQHICPTNTENIYIRDQYSTPDLCITMIEVILANTKCEHDRPKGLRDIAW